MTTLIVVAIVGLVFFVTICVAGFMVWKRETEIRTDSIGAIERSIGEVVNELSGINSEINAESDPLIAAPHQPMPMRDEYGCIYEAPYGEYDRNYNRNYRAYGQTTRGSESRRTNNSRKEPYEWVRSDERNASNVSVFRPERGTTRRLRWTDVSDAGGDEPVRQTTRPASRLSGRFRRRQDAVETPQNTDSVYEYDIKQESVTEPKYMAESWEADTNMDMNAGQETADTNAENSPDIADEQKPSDEINLSLIDLDSIDSINLDEFEFFDNEEKSEARDDYSTGRSGKKYTAQELESLIKE